MLSELTSLRVGGSAEFVAEPTTQVELAGVIRQCLAERIPYRILGRGSNVFVASAAVPGCVIRNTLACSELEINGDLVRVGSSVALQRMILECGRHGLGGAEYLYSVPATVGGAVYMNAGRGRRHRKSISDYIRRVLVFDGHRQRWMSRRACRFRYRWSVFHKRPNLTILAAELKLEHLSKEEVGSRVRTRSLLVKNEQDNRWPNAGTVYKQGFARAKYLRNLRRGGAAFSAKTDNWIVNDSNGSSEDVLALLEFARRSHIARSLPEPVLEWIVW